MASSSFLGFRGDEAGRRGTREARRKSSVTSVTTPKAASKPTSDKTEDRRYLAQLLRSYKAHSELVSEPARVEVGAYAKRKEYTNHPRDKEAWPYLLLNQVEIAYRTDSISPKIELIDLPGLGARLFSDDLLTEAFLPKLDGALVFQSSEQVAAKEAYDLLAKLGQQFRRMEGRVWMIFTRFDGLAKDHYGSSPDSVNILDNIAKTLADNKVPSEQVLMVGNEFHRRLLDTDGRVKAPTPELLRVALNLDLDAENRPVLPEGFNRHEMLSGAFREIIRDGGTTKVREMIGEVLRIKVESEVRDAVDAELRALRSELSRLLISALEAMKMDSSGFRRAVQWKVRLQETRQALDRKRTIMEEQTIQVIKELQQEFTESLCPPTLVLERAKLPNDHRQYARVLRDQTTFRYKTELVPAVFGWVTEQFRTAHASFGDVRLNGHANPLLAWEERNNRDLSEITWLSPVISYDDPPLFSAAGDDDVQLDGRNYRAAMLRKVETICHRAVLALSRRIKTHIDELIDGLALLHEAEERVDSAAPAVFQEILQALA